MLWFPPWLPPWWSSSSLDHILKDLRDFIKESMQSLYEPLMLWKTRYTCPYIDLHEEKDKYIVTIDLPGMTKEDVDIRVSENSLEVLAEKKSREEKKEKGKYYLKERQAKFYKKLPLPEDVLQGNIKTSYENGLLKIVLLKIEITKEKKNWN